MDCDMSAQIRATHGHEISWVAAYIIELKSRLPDEVVKGAMGS